MTRRTTANQRGDVMLVIVIALAIALVSAIGFIVWQNVNNNNDVEREEEVSRQINKEAPVLDEEVLEFPAWGVEMPLSDGTPKLTLKRISNLSTGDAYSIAIDEEGCSGSLGSVYRVSKGDRNTDDRSPASDKGKTYGELAEESQYNYALVDEYVYYFSWSMAPSCDDEHSYAEDDFDHKLFSEQVSQMRKTE